ncbi:MAG: glycosyltransferase family 2 protein [Acidobacteria bacterium]|nr:glycosyltransferase family 2 protein [Acidobacteriota bacterium]
MSIIIPAYNEALRIEETLRTVESFLALQTYRSEVIVIDDGSTDATAALLDDYSKHRPSVRVLRHQSNTGKGASVRTGVLAARGRYVFFMDADLSVPITELTGALTALADGDAPIVIGSRKVQGARIEQRQPWLREILGHGFTWFTGLLLWRTIVDFTCGFKGFRRDEAMAIFSRQRCNDWAFDAEVLYLARLMGMSVHQYPVRWSHRSNSRVRFPRDIYQTLGALISIRWRVSRAMRKGSAASQVDRVAD